MLEWYSYIRNRFKIEAASLETLTYEPRSPLKLEAVCCSDLKRLNIRISINISSKYIEKLISKFPSLVDLELTVDCWKPAVMKMSLHQLETVKIHYTYMKNSIDTPSLHYYSYSDHIKKHSQYICFCFSMKPNVVKLQLRCFNYKHLGTSWFLNLQQFLAKFTPHKEITLTFEISNVEGKVSPEMQMALFLMFVFM